MKRGGLIAVLLLAVLAAGAGAWWFFARGFALPGSPGSVSALIPSGPIACPTNPSDLSAIEGWAPGAGHAQEAGRANVGNFGAFGGALGGGSGGTPTPAGTTCEGLGADIAARFDRIATKISAMPSDGYDPGARAAELGDADAIFAFVRDRIGTENYPGAMRGASGTLQSHGGSPADKALLLAALLASKSVAVRFVHTSLTDDEAGRIATIANAAPRPDSSPLPDDAFRRLETDATAARAGIAEVRKRAEDGANGVLADARSATEDLLSVTSAANVRVGDDDSAAQSRAIANLRDHWWVQAQEEGAWVDLDPSLPDMQLGKHLGTAPADAPADALPDSVVRRLTVRLVADRLSGSTPSTSTLVERTIKLTDDYAVPIVVTIGDRSTGSDKIATATSFTPSISVAGDEQSGPAFGTDGLATVRLQIETGLGGNVRRIASRLVLDRRRNGTAAIDPAWTPATTATALTVSYAILAPTGDLDPAFAGVREAAGMQSLRAFMAYAAAGGDGRQMPPSAGIAEGYPLEALHYFEADALLRRLLEDGSNGTVRFVFDHPQVAFARRGFTLSNGKLAGVESFDIADNAMTAAGTDRKAAVRANVTRGYADTVVEQHLFAAPGDGGTIALFAAAKANGVATRVVSGEAYGGTALAPIATVTLNGKPRTGWWQLDPQDGNIVGRMDDGAGQELVEYAIARANDWSTLYAMIQFYGDFFRCIAGAVESPLSGDQAHAQAWFKQCAGAAICAYLEALGTGEAFSRWGSDEEALLYNILDLSVPGSKDSLPPTGGAACSGLFTSPLYPSPS